MTPIFNTKKTVTEQSDSSATTASEQKELPKVEESSSAPVRSSSSSSRSNMPSEYDNMRGFDPASENDMDDNGMSRYMENYDDEGWD